MTETLSYTEYHNGCGKIRQYVGCGGTVQMRETTEQYADRLSSNWVRYGNSAIPTPERMATAGWTLAGEPVTIGISINDYDTLHRVLGIPRDSWNYILPIREAYKASANSAKLLDKDLPVDPLVKTTKSFGGVRKYQIPLDFVHEGALITVTRKHEVIDAVAHMDGHSVSQNYGRVNGSAHYIGNENPDNYINVRFPGRDYSYAGRPNDSLSVKKGDKVWVSEADYNRYVRDHAALVERTESAKTAVKRLNVQQKINAARKMLEEAESELAAIS